MWEQEQEALARTRQWSAEGPGGRPAYSPLLASRWRQSGRPITLSPAEWAPHRSEEKRRLDLFCLTLTPPFCNCLGGLIHSRKEKQRDSRLLENHHSPSTQLFAN